METAKPRAKNLRSDRSCGVPTFNRSAWTCCACHQRSTGRPGWCKRRRVEHQQRRRECSWATPSEFFSQLLTVWRLSSHGPLPHQEWNGHRSQGIEKRQSSYDGIVSICRYSWYSYTLCLSQCCHLWPCKPLHQQITWSLPRAQATLILCLGTGFWRRHCLILRLEFRIIKICEHHGSRKSMRIEIGSLVVVWLWKYELKDFTGCRMRWR